MTNVNDFTKEELEDLFTWGEVYCVDRSTITKMHQFDLLGKIQSMIERFCEHEYYLLAIDSPSSHVKKCKNCGNVGVFNE